jgi:hypothetical protein
LVDQVKMLNSMKQCEHPDLTRAISHLSPISLEGYTATLIVH